MKHILIVDDETAAVSGLKMLLELDGHTVTATDSAAQAVELLGARPFDAVVTDLEMPDVGGIGVVRAAAAAGGSVVFVLTGYPDSPAAKVALELGARRVLDKPLDYDALAAELASM